MSDYKFVSTDAEEIVQALISAYELLTGVAINPASPERLFISWVADMIVQERVLINYTANQNLPSHAVGMNLDNLGELFYDKDRPQAQKARTTIEVTLSAAQSGATLIPAGTRFTDANFTMYWTTQADAYISAGQTKGTVEVVCETAGEEGNGWVAGQIQTLVDISNIRYYLSCANTTESDGGANTATDEEYYALMRASEDAYSVAGPMGAYEYWAKQVSTNIVDVKAQMLEYLTSGEYEKYGDSWFVGGYYLDVTLTSLKVYIPGDTPTEVTRGTDYTAAYSEGLLKITAISGGALENEDTILVNINCTDAGHVSIYALEKDTESGEGVQASALIKAAILAACNERTIRPLTDFVEVKDPDTVNYQINFTYYIPSQSMKPAAEIEADVEKVVKEYRIWQSAVMGRDINPSKLISMLMETGIKRVAVTSPVFTEVAGNKPSEVPKYAVCTSETIVNGGFEDE